MINKVLRDKISDFFVNEPTKEQKIAAEKLSDYIFSPFSDRIFLLRGYAGTGKTTVVGALVGALGQIGIKTMLLAPTGRAAKVLSAFAGRPAFTIHKKIYRQNEFSNDMDNYSLMPNLYKDTVFIVDEASMISNQGLSSAFSGGRLLDDLLRFVFSSERCRLVLTGDTAQLPPVGECESPALSRAVLEGCGFGVDEYVMRRTVRQEESSGILWNATMIRRLLDNEQFGVMPALRSDGFADVARVGGMDIIGYLSDSYSEVGRDETIVITRSNKRAGIFNRGIRNTVLYNEDMLSTGDMLMIAKNNYYWAEDVKEMEFIANGDIARVERIRNQRELYGFKFADVTMSFPDYDDVELDATVLLDTLYSDYASLSREDDNRLYEKVVEDYSYLPTKGERVRGVKSDQYFNALQVKFAYAVTCHKAQGGQWKHVYLDKGYVTDEMVDADFMRWLYTAVTRATEKLYIIG